MAHKITLSLFLLSVLKIVVSQYNCNANEYLTETVNPCNTCDTRGWCPENYGAACDCIPGYFRNSQGMCVPPEACDGPYGTPYGKDEAYNCGENEEFQSCGTSCPATCENPRPNSGVCIQRCVTGCFCTAGYVRKGGKCVRESECNAPSSVRPRNYHVPGPYAPGPYRPPPRPVTNPPVVRPPPIASSYPAPAPPVYKPPIRPIHPPPPPPTYPPVPPTDPKGCPNRNLCNRKCKSEGFAVGFCVENKFLKCNCMG